MDDNMCKLSSGYDYKHAIRKEHVFSNLYLPNYFKLNYFAGKNLKILCFIILNLETSIS